MTDAKTKKPKPEPVVEDDDQDVPDVPDAVEVEDDDQDDEDDDQDDEDDQARPAPKSFTAEHPPALRRKKPARQRQAEADLPTHAALRLW